MKYTINDKDLVAFLNGNRKDTLSGTILGTIYNKDYIMYIKLSKQDSSGVPQLIAQFKKQNEEKSLYTDTITYDCVKYFELQATLVNIFLYQCYTHDKS